MNLRASPSYSFLCDDCEANWNGQTDRRTDRQDHVLSQADALTKKLELIARAQNIASKCSVYQGRTMSSENKCCLDKIACASVSLTIFSFVTDGSRDVLTNNHIKIS